MDIIKELRDFGLVPVIKITKVENALPLAKALAAGGLNCAEITFRTECAADAIAAITKEMPDMLVGAGTVLTPEQADETCGVIRNTIKSLYGEKAAEEIIIQYGGSMNAGNAAELLAKENVDGGLIGGASLKAKDFSIIVEAAQ